jgi:tetratricopeptide (TPR) repeat protein
MQAGGGRPPYTRIVARLVLLFALLLLSSSGLLAQKKPVEPPKPPPAKEQDVVEPPEEDESLKPTVYAFNPLEAQKDVRTGEYYFKKGNFKAAARRFDEATKYDPGYAEAYLRLGDARERMHDKKGAHEAYRKYLQLKPDGKESASLRKKVH